MNRIRIGGIVVATCLAIAGALQAAPVIEKPAVLPEAMLSITVSDVHGMLDGIGGVAAQTSPMMNGMMIKNMIGMQLGDPGLAGIPPGKGLAVVALDATNVFAVIEVGAAQISAYTNALAPKGLQFKVERGLLVVGKTIGQVAKGCGLADAVKETLLARRSPALRIAMQPSAIIERNQDQIQGMLQMMPIMMGQSMMQAPGATLESTQNTLKFLEGELRVLLSLAGQCETAEVVLALDDGSLRISETFAPKTGTRLSTFCNAPAVNQPNHKLQSGLLGGGMMLIDATIGNPVALSALVAGETEQVIKEMQLEVEDRTDLIKSMTKWMGIYGGSFCESVGFGGDAGFSVNCLMEVKDEKAALELFKTMEQDMEPFLGLYDDLGMPMDISFKEGVREHEGVKIHQFRVDIAMTNLPPEQCETMASMNMTNMVYDIAIADDIMIFAMGSTKVEDLIDRLKEDSCKPVPLKARAVYPEGGFYYLDLDMGEYVAFINTFMPGGNLAMKQQVDLLFEGVEPITSAGFKADGRVMWSFNIPGGLIGKFSQMAMMMQMQQMQQQSMGVPQGMPQQLPVQ